MSTWKAMFEEVVGIWSKRKTLASNIYSMVDCEVNKLIALEGEYQDKVANLASQVKCFSEAEKAFAISCLEHGDEKQYQVACHIFLLSRDVNFQSLILEMFKEKEAYAHSRIIPVVRLCSREIIKNFSRKALELNLLWVHDSFATVLAKNCLRELSHYYFSNDGLKYFTSSIVEMLGYLGEIDCCSILKSELGNEDNGIDQESRAAIHQELVIYSGKYFPFDEERYLSEQIAQCHYWVKQLEEAPLIPTGKWIRYGSELL